MVAPRTWAVLAFGAVVAASLARAQTTFESGSQQINAMRSAIASRVPEIEALRNRALKEGSPLKVSCIEEKLKRARANAALSNKDIAAWPATRERPPEQLRVLEHMRLLDLYSMTFVQDARACVDAHAAESTLQVVVEGAPTTPPTAIDPVPPPTLERPPLASTF
jgi:hypothetical protein